MYFAQQICFCLQNVLLFLKINLLSLCNIIPLKINFGLYPGQRNSAVLITSHVAWGRLPDMGHFQFVLAAAPFVFEQLKGRLQQCGPEGVERWWELWSLFWAARTPVLCAQWQTQEWPCPHQRGFKGVLKWNPPPPQRFPILTELSTSMFLFLSFQVVAHDPNQLQLWIKWFTDTISCVAAEKKPTR